MGPRRVVPAGALGESARRPGVQPVGAAVRPAPGSAHPGRSSSAGCGKLVGRPPQYAKSATYQRARQQAGLACRLIPQDGEFLTTLGAAQDRVANDAEAVDRTQIAKPVDQRMSGGRSPVWRRNRLRRCRSKFNSGALDQSDEQGYVHRGQSLAFQRPICRVLGEVAQRRVNKKCNRRTKHNLGHLIPVKLY